MYLMLSRVVRKRLFAYAKTKTQISFAVTAKLISPFVFAIRIVQFLFSINPKFQASSHLLWLYSPICVGPGRKPRRPVFSERDSYTVIIETDLSKVQYVQLSCRPLLFLCHINDLPECVESQIRLFADDRLLYRTIKSPKDHQILQQDLINLQKWASDWGMKFNGKKMLHPKYQKPIKQLLYSCRPNPQTSPRPPIHKNYHLRRLNYHLRRLKMGEHT